jgi:hypothetical protein
MKASGDAKQIGVQKEPQKTRIGHPDWGQMAGMCARWRWVA